MSNYNNQLALLLRSDQANDRCVTDMTPDLKKPAPPALETIAHSWTKSLKLYNSRPPEVENINNLVLCCVYMAKSFTEIVEICCPPPRIKSFKQGIINLIRISSIAYLYTIYLYNNVYVTNAPVQCTTFLSHSWGRSGERKGEKRTLDNRINS